ncbi:MAG: flagellar basal body P-ring protein FlgI [Phycisphaerales bacterium]|nr:flagellar basal body P-ring protein FlgI [Phycisphaerales bacterium]
MLKQLDDRAGTSLPPARIRVRAASGSRLRRGALLSAALCGCLFFASCTWETEDYRKHALGVDPRKTAAASSASYRDTIGERATFQGLAPMKVRGYGLVVGLGKNGSTDCPPHVLNRLVQQIEKRYPLKSTRVSNVSLTPEQLIRDADTAVVLVEGVIPGAAAEGTHFDVFVSALPETETTSLRGGRLFTSELEYGVRVQDDSTDAIMLSGRTLAFSAGPVFMNPFTRDEGAATESNPKQGMILGGGVVTESRRLRLVLTEPSPSVAMQIEDRINTKFSKKGKVADAIAPAFVQLTIPEEFKDDATHFLLLVQHLYLPNQDGFPAQRSAELAQEMVQPGAPHVAIALAFEAIGDASLPFLTPLYAHKQDYVSFHAAAAGLRLGDDVAVQPLARLAGDKDSPFRFQAIRALGAAGKVRDAATPLRKLLDDPDPRVRIEAYEELARRGDPALDRSIVGGDNFVLDVVGSSQPPIIHARRSGERRIAVIGDALHCRTPVFYRSPDGVLLINAESQTDQLTLLRTVPASGHTSPPILAKPDVTPLITLLGEDAAEVRGNVTGLGLDYTTVVHALYTLCSSASIDAQFDLEEANLAEMFGPDDNAGRPESEE